MAAKDKLFTPGTKALLETRVALPATTKKKVAEAQNFEAFRSAHPNFAGRPLVSVQWGDDPPDVLCRDASREPIGVELIQWVNERQMAASKARCKFEDSYRRVIRSPEVQPPANIGIIFIHPKEGTPLLPANASTFRAELYNCIGAIDSAWPSNPEWDDPQGYPFNDFTGYPSLVHHISELIVYARGRSFSPALGSDWLTFEMRGGVYTTDWMRDALLENIRKKIGKYAKPYNKEKLERQRLAEFNLLAYYDEAVLYNTPYHVPGFGFKEIAEIVSRELAANSHPFDKVFLYSPIEKAVPAIQIWPR